MKTTLCLLMLSFASVSFADCITTYNNGAKLLAKGDAFSAKSQEILNHMTSLAEDGANTEVLCKTGIDARLHSYLAVQNFKNSRANFIKAINECSAPNDAKAAKLADRATEAYNANAEFIADMDNLLGRQCGAAPVTPLL